jgi:integrase
MATTSKRRTKGAGSIVKRTNSKGVPTFAPVFTDPHTSKRVWLPPKATKAAAEKDLRAALASADRGEVADPSRVALGSFLTDEWLPSLRRKVKTGDMRESTAATYERLVACHLVPHLGAIPLRSLTPKHLNRMYGELLDGGRRDGKGGLSARTVSYVGITLHQALDFAVRQGLLSWNVADRADPPKSKRKEAAHWTAPESRIFLQHVADDRLVAAYVTVSTTGMRRGELLGLRWADVDLDEGTLAIRRTLVTVDYRLVESESKTEAGLRTIAIGPATVAALRAHRARQAQERLAFGPDWLDEGRVFCREDGGPIHPQALTLAFKRHAKAAGLPRLTFHGLRHSYATAALESGEELKDVSVRLGHASVGITADIYQHVTLERSRQTAVNSEAYLLGSNGN